jgi:hypothetical protein
MVRLLGKMVEWTVIRALANVEYLSVSRVFQEVDIAAERFVEDLVIHL